VARVFWKRGAVGARRVFHMLSDPAAQSLVNGGVDVLSKSAIVKSTLYRHTQQEPATPHAKVSTR
jgi:hypothetical protein